MANKEKKKKSNGIGTASIVIIVIAGLFLGLLLVVAPEKSITCSRMVTEEYQDIERVQDTEQYIDTTYTNVDLRYRVSYDAKDSWCVDEECSRTEQFCVDKNFWGNCVKFETRCISTSCEKEKVYCKWILKNLDNEGGYWTIRKTIDADKDFEDDDKVWVSASDERSFSHSAVISYGESWTCKYKVLITPTKSVSSQAIKERKIWKDKPVTRTREVEEEYRKQVNWIYGEC